MKLYLFNGNHTSTNNFIHQGPCIRSFHFTLFIALMDEAGFRLFASLQCIMGIGVMHRVRPDEGLRKHEGYFGNSETQEYCLVFGCSERSEILKWSFWSFLKMKLVMFFEMARPLRLRSIAHRWIDSSIGRRRSRRRGDRSTTTARYSPLDDLQTIYGLDGSRRPLYKRVNGVCLSHRLRLHLL